MPVRQKTNLVNKDRIQNLKKKRRLRLKRKIARIVVFGILIVTILSIVAHLNKITITEIKIEGNTVTNTGVIESIAESKMADSYALLFPKKNIFLYPKRAIRDQIITNIKRISAVSIERTSLHSIVIKITEREGQYLWCGISDSISGKQCFFLDSKGYIFSTAPYFSGNVYLKFFGVYKKEDSPVGKTFLTQNEFVRLLDFIDELQANSIEVFGLTVKEKGYEILLGDPEDDKVIPRIIVLESNNFHTILNNLKEALKTEPFASDFKDHFDHLIYIDLRYNNKVYYKFSPITASF